MAQDMKLRYNQFSTNPKNGNHFFVGQVSGSNPSDERRNPTFLLSSCRRAISAIKQTWHLAFQVSNEECNINAIKCAVTIDVAGGIEGIGSRGTGWETIYWRRIIVSLKIIDCINDIDAVD